MSVVLDLLLPPRCLACGWTGAEPLCGRCDDLLEPDEEGYELAPGVVAVAPYVYTDPLAAAIKRVKTDALRAGARALAGLLAPHLPHSTPRTWVPATPRRRRRRGLDLPEHLAGVGSRRLLRAAHDRPDHGNLGAVARRRSAPEGYLAVGPAPAAVVLVDDVRATGATLLAAATALRTAGARRVLAVSLAASPGRPSAARPHGDPAADPDPTSAGGSGRWS